MNFSEFNFIFIFLPIILVIYRLVPKRARRIVLIVGSLTFYIYGTISSYIWAPIALVFITLLEYLLYLWEFHIRDKSIRLSKFLKVTEIVLLAIVLVICKLLNLMPLGISFYIFQMISLQVDLWSYTKVGLLDYFSFILMFPKLAMGPIARFKDTTDFNIDYEGGLKDYTVGLGMKVLLADQLATLWNSISVSGADGIATNTAWLGAISYTLELYLDFWGYSLMAIGLGKMLGIRIPKNFDSPYSSKTVGEFWRRWHITLGAWFRDYIYIPLGGNRLNKFHTIINLLIVWLLTGLWHGNGFNYIIWGLVLYIFIVLERLSPLGKLSDSKVLGHIYILLLMPITWMIFANNSLFEMCKYVLCMFGIHSTDVAAPISQFMRYVYTYWYIIAISLFVASPWSIKLYKRFKDSIIGIVVLFIIFWLSVFMIGIGSVNGFMYYQF